MSIRLDEVAADLAKRNIPRMGIDTATRGAREWRVCLHARVSGSVYIGFGATLDEAYLAALENFDADLVEVGKR